MNRRRLAQGGLVAVLALALVVLGVPLAAFGVAYPVSGYVYEEGTLDPIEGAEVQLWEYDDSFPDDPWMKVDTAYTDADGFFYFDSSNMANGLEYSCDVYADGYFEYVSDTPDLQLWNGSTPLYFEIPLMPAEATAYGWVVDADTGGGIEGADVWLYTYNDMDGWLLIDEATTDVDGYWRSSASLSMGEGYTIDVQAAGYDSYYSTEADLVTYVGDPLEYYTELAADPYLYLEETEAGITFDRFVAAKNAAYSGGAYLYGRWTNTELQVRFTGNEIAWFGPMQPSYGMADIYIDNVKVGTADCFASGSEASLSEEIWRSGALDDGPHTMRIRLVGQKNAASTGYVVVVDQIQIGGMPAMPDGERFDDKSGTFTGAWVKPVNIAYFGDAYAYSYWKGASFKKTFYGTRVAWIGPRNNNYGRAAVYIDGVFKATVSQYGATGWRYRVWESAVLPEGNHTLEIRVLGTKDTASKGAIIVVDAVDVQGGL